MVPPRRWRRCFARWHRRGRQATGLAQGEELLLGGRIAQGIGFTAGVLIGDLLTASPGWRWVFFVNVPVDIALLAALPATMSAPTE